MEYKGHKDVNLGPFKGLWQRGDPDNTPLDHFQDGDNIQFVAQEFKTTDGVGVSQTVTVPLAAVKRIYNYPTTTGQTLLVMIEATNGHGQIYHVVDKNTVYGPILDIATMTDFACQPYAGRCYITPFSSYQVTNLEEGELNLERGLQNEFLYVYLGAGVAARKAAGNPPVGALTVANGAAGHTTPGFKVFAVVFESDTGWLSSPAAFATFNTAAGSSVSFGTVPVGGVGQGIVKRHIVATLVIPSYSGNPEGYQFFFIPGGTINDNVTLFLNNVSWYDEELLDDASHLLDNYASIPAGVNLCLYHDRLVLIATYADISIALISAPGEPEAISQLTGIVVVTPDGNPLTNCQEIRDVLYLFKRSRTVSYVDNGDEPSTWKFTVVDTARGCPVHGIASVLDSGGSSVDFLLIATYSGIMLFNGRFILQELSWKVQDLWTSQDRNEFRHIQIVNAPTQNWILCVLPDSRLLRGDYTEGMSWKNIKWTTRSFEVYLNCIALVNIDQIILGMELVE